MVVLATAAGALLGHWLMGPHGMALGACGGAALAALWGLALDGLRAKRLADWVRGELHQAAPHAQGLWGELGYRMERALREREQQARYEREQLQQFLSAIEASPNGVLMLDAHDHILWCNHTAAEHFSLNASHDLMQRVTNLVRDPAFVAYLHAEQFHQALVLHHVRGKATLQVIVRVYGDQFRLVLTQDITERERHDAMRRDFVANVSHEIRTPLTVLSGFIETLDKLPLTDVERRRVLQLMGEQATRMQSLVGDLLTLAQLEGGPKPPPDQWLHLEAVLQRALSDAQALSAGRHHISRGEPCELAVAGVKGELLSALANLLSNAVRYTPEGGSIQVQWARLADGSCEISVSDNGPGIAREHLPRLAERFYRVDGSRSRDTGGTGLGLSIVKHVAQRHGGTLRIESEVGQGSRFVVLLPASRVRQMTEAPLQGARAEPASTISH
ncbi:phosphate regulon sensor histidine kinase PhoR [Roseateles sp. BYS180W]|uniref:Phosphate regulon sensor protein PhoR n=1 Tax=Roseateles rivi TaxID=3299028 RepID=A0ABW7FZ51_9BURK